MFSITKVLGEASLVYLPVSFQIVLKIMTLYVYVYVYNVRKKGRKVLISYCYAGHVGNKG
jgi:hypothetical protein